MMLMYCPECQDVIKISKVEHRSCYCGKTSGRFDIDGNVTVLFGEAVPLRISTNSLKEAVDHRSIRNKERKFNAFVVPLTSKRIKLKDI